MELVTQKQRLSTLPKRRMTVENSNVLNDVFNGIDMEQFKVIAIIEIAKQAWTILQNWHEGNIIIRMSKLQIITTCLKI